MSEIAEANCTIEWLTEKLRSKFKLEAELMKWNCKRIGYGDGFASVIVLVEFEWGSETELPNSVILKVKETI